MQGGEYRAEAFLERMWILRNIDDKDDKKRLSSMWCQILSFEF